MHTQNIFQPKKTEFTGENQLRENDERVHRTDWFPVDILARKESGAKKACTVYIDYKGQVFIYFICIDYKGRVFIYFVYIDYKGWVFIYFVCVDYKGRIFIPWEVENNTFLQI